MSRVTWLAELYTKERSGERVGGQCGMKPEAARMECYKARQGKAGDGGGMTDRPGSTLLAVAIDSTAPPTRRAAFLSGLPCLHSTRLLWRPCVNNMS